MTEPAPTPWTMVYDAEGLPARAYVLAFGAEREHPDDMDAEIRWIESAVSAPPRVMPANAT